MFTLPRFATGLDSLLASLPPVARSQRGLCVALSGGLDSTVLLVALAQLRDAGRLRSPLRAIHVDHALHSDSPQWAAACRSLAARHAVALAEVRVDVALGQGASPEAAAREARYAAFVARLVPGEVLLTAHHADDQLETILLQWLRGGGLRAVAGMAPAGPLGTQAWHVRPLLEFARADLAHWAGEQRLRWQEDPSNLDRRFDRNYLRHEVLPALRARWPAAATTAGRVAGFAREALAAEAAMAATDLTAVRAGQALELPVLLKLPEPRQRAALRAWIEGLGLPPPTARGLAALRRDMVEAAADRVPESRWPGAVVRRYRDRLYAATAGAPPAPQAGTWCAATMASYAWSAASSLTLRPATGVGLSRERLPGTLTVRPRAGGETFVPGGGAHRRELRKWLQEHDVLPWRRADLPLLFAGDRLVAVADLGVAADFAARSDEPSWRIVWQGRGCVTGGDVVAAQWPLHPPIR